MSRRLTKQCKLFLRAERFRDCGDAERALDAYDRFLAGEQRFRRALIGKAWALERLDRDEEAHRAINKAVSLDRRDPEALSLQAYLSEKEGDFFGADLVISPLVDTHPPDPTILHRQASLLLSMGEPGRAFSRIWRARQMRGSDAEIRALFAETLFRQGKHEWAYRSAESALEISKGVRGPRVLLAHAALERGDDERALTLARGECAIDPRSAVAWTQRALAAARSRRYEEAYVARSNATKLSDSSLAGDIELPWESAGYVRAEFGEIGQLNESTGVDESRHVEPVREIPESKAWLATRRKELEQLRIPADDRRSRAILSEAHQYAEGELWHTACLYARFVLDRGHFRREAMTVLARSLDALHRYDDGLEAWTVLCRECPGHKEAWRQVLRRETSARLLADLAFEAEFAGVELLEAKVADLRANFEESRLSACTDEARRLAKHGHRDAWVDVILGCDLAERGQFHLAQPRLERAARAGRKEALLLFLLGSHHEKRGEFGRARRFYEQLVEVSPTFVHERFESLAPLSEFAPVYSAFVGPLYAECLLVAGHHAEAHSIFEDWCVAHPEDADSWERLAELRESNEGLIPNGVPKSTQEIRRYVSALRAGSESDVA